MNENHKLRVFLCHASQDKPAVRELYRKLLAEGWIDPWLDEEKLLPGQDWDIEIEKAVETADIVIVFLSQNAVTKEGYVQKELRHSLSVALMKPEGTIFVVPLRLDNCQVPRRLQTWQYADYFPADSRERAYDRLISSFAIRAASKRIHRVANLEKVNESENRGGKPQMASAGVSCESEGADLSSKVSVFRGHDKQINGLAFSPDGKFLVTVGGGYWGSGSKQIILWDFVRNRNIIYEAVSTTVWCVSFSPNGNLFASGGYRVRLWNVEGKLLSELRAQSDTVKHLSFLNKGRLLASLDRLGTLTLWDTEGYGFVRSHKFNYEANLYSDATAAFSPKTSMLAFRNSKSYGRIELWDVIGEKLVTTLTVNKGLAWISSLTFSSDGKFLALGLQNNQIYIWDLSSGKLTRTLEGHTKPVECVAVSPDNKYLASGSKDRTVQLWDISTGMLLHTLTDHFSRVNCVAFSPDGKYLVSGSHDQTLRVLRLSVEVV